MRDKRLLHLTLPGWLKWGLGIFLFLSAACLAFGIYLYQAAENNRTAKFDQIKTQLLEESKLNSISKIERFHGKNAFYTVYGKIEDDSDVILFYPFGKNASDIIRVNQSNIIAEEEIKADWHKQCDACTLFDVKPAVISSDGNQPAWEITYENDENQYVMEYLSFQDGSIIEVIRFNQLFD